MSLEPRRARVRFIAALVLFALWVASLAALALITGKKPPSPRERATVSRGKE